MTSKATCIISCFGYLGHEKYAFDPTYIRSDLKRILTYTLNIVRAPPSSILVLTDLNPDITVVNEMYSQFQDMLIDHLVNKIGYTKPVDKSGQTKLWLSKTIKVVAKHLGVSHSDLYSSIPFIPMLSVDNVIEYASLFCTFRLVSGSNDYYDILQDQLSTKQLVKEQPSILMYFTGHGVIYGRKMNLVIRNRDGLAEYLSVDHIQHLIDRLPNGTRGLIVFDCCHAGCILNLSNSSTDMVFVASCLKDETCGFYDSKKSKRCGSLFTYHFVNALLNRERCLSDMIPDIQKTINEYRKIVNKPIQTISYQTSKIGSNMIPKL